MCLSEGEPSAGSSSLFLFCMPSLLPFSAPLCAGWCSTQAGLWKSWFMSLFVIVQFLDLDFPPCVFFFFFLQVGQQMLVEAFQGMPEGFYQLPCLTLGQAKRPLPL